MSSLPLGLVTFPDTGVLYIQNVTFMCERAIIFTVYKNSILFDCYIYFILLLIFLTLIIVDLYISLLQIYLHIFTNGMLINLAYLLLDVCNAIILFSCNKMKPTILLSNVFRTAYAGSAA